LALEDQTRIKWVGSASHRTLLEGKPLEDLQPDGSVQSTRGGGKTAHLTFVVEVANSETLLKVRNKVGKWLLHHFVRAALIINITHKKPSTEDESESLKISFELWRRMGVPAKTMKKIKLSRDGFKNSVISWCKRVMVMWDGEAWDPTIEGQEPESLVDIASLVQHTDACEVNEVCDPFDEVNSMLTAGRNQPQNRKYTSGPRTSMSRTLSWRVGMIITPPLMLM
jgi:hypothetical protein